MHGFKVLAFTGLILAANILSAFAMGNNEYIQETLIGKPAADFTLNTVKGEKVNLTKYRNGKKAILFFWATWCPHCRQELERLNRMHSQISAKGIQLIFISLGEDKRTVQNYLERNDFKFEAVLDEDQSLADAYRIIGVPTLFFLNEQGVIKFVSHAFLEDFEEIFN